MLNNIYYSSSLVYNSTNEFESNNKKHLTTNDYIEIPKQIRNFNQIMQYEDFINIKFQYINYLNELSKLYYHFTGLDNTNLDSIIDYIKNDITKSSDDNILFYSYKIIRMHIYNIITYLSEYKDKHITNDTISIICAKLTDCFDVCFEGFNSKILRIGEYISSSNNINEKISLKTREFIEETINNLLIKYNHNINIHEKNALFNLVSSDFNFDHIHDKYANLNYFDDISIKDLIYELDISLSGFNICKLIVEELYLLFKDIITNTGKIKWFDSYIENMTAESTFYLEDHFIDLVNKYLNIELEEDKLTITDVISLTEKDKIHISNIKDKLHFLCAKYINKSSHCYTKLLKCNSRIITKLNNNTAIFSINNKYFYIVDNNITTSIQLNHLEMISLSNLYTIEVEVYIPILIQALEQTFSTEKIYHFFSNIKQQLVLYSYNNSYFICRELNKILTTNHLLRNRVLYALLDAHLKNDININKTCNKLINNNIIVNELLKNFLINKIDILAYLTNMPQKSIFRFIVSLNSETIENFFLNENLYNYITINKIRSILFYLFIEKKWQLIERLLKSKIKFFIIKNLTDKQKKRALRNVLDYRQYNIAEYFLLNYVQMNIKDTQKNNILHHTILNNNLFLLKKINANIDNNTLHKLLSCKNNQGLTPLMMSMVLGENIEYFYTILDCCNDDIISITNDGNNAIMLAAKDGHDRCLQSLIAKTSKYSLLINSSNKSNYNCLMLAIKNQHDACTNIIFNNMTTIDLKKREYNRGYTAIHLAILYKSKFIKQLINKADKDTLFQLSYACNSILSIAAQVNDEKSIDLILDKCGGFMIYERNLQKLNPLMIAASNGYLNCLKKLFKYSEKKLLLQKTKHGNNILMLATKNGHADCVNFLLQNCQKEILKKLYKQCNDFGYDVLSIANYCNKKPNYIEDGNEESNKKHKKILDDLNQYTPC